MRFNIITIFPSIFYSYFNESILARAQKEKLITIRAHDMRKFSRDKHKKVDDKPYGGGAGMVLQAKPILRAVEAVLKIKNHPVIRQGVLSDDRAKTKTKIIILSAKGKQFTQKMAYNWAKNFNQLILISGRYEGIDERVKSALHAEEIAIGPYVLTDGDAAAMVIVSAVARLIPGVINFESLQEESFFSNVLKTEIKKPGACPTGRRAGSRERGAALAEYPHYTRPEIFEWKDKKYRVPKILLSGDHKKIAAWRRSRMK